MKRWNELTHFAGLDWAGDHHDVAVVDQQGQVVAEFRIAHSAAERIWVMDRGIPTEAVLAELRQSDPKVRYLVGTPKGRLTQLDKELADKPWQQVRPHLRVKLLPQEGEVYVLAESGARTAKKRGMRRRKLKALWQRLNRNDAVEKGPPIGN